MNKLPTPLIDAATGLPSGTPVRPDWEVTPVQLKALIDAGKLKGAVLLDCRRGDEWSFNRLPGAVHIPMDQIEHRADELEDGDGRRTHPVFVYCHHGRRSMVVAQALRAMGYSGAMSLAGGIDAWSMSIDQSLPRY